MADETTADETAATVRRVLAARLEWPPSDPRLADDAELAGETIGLDSLLVVEFAMDLEDEFEIELPESDMATMAEMTIGQVASLVQERTPPPTAD